MVLVWGRNASGRYVVVEKEVLVDIMEGIPFGIEARRIAGKSRRRGRIR